MAEPLWYYSQDGRECGPVPTPRLVELATAGTVKPTDLVWREGMEDWAPAGQVKGLFAPPPQSAPGAQAAAPTSKGPPTPPQLRVSLDGAMAGLLRRGSAAARGLLVSGFILIVVARGCDQLGERGIARMAAKQATAQQQFEDTWKANRTDLQEKIDALSTPKPERSPDEQKELQRLRTELGELPQKEAEARKKLASGEWRNLEIAARDARFSNAIWAYWREMLFIIGTLCFTTGLVLVGFAAQGPERWMALIMLAIVAYSIFIGGAAWGTAARGPLN